MMREIIQVTGHAVTPDEFGNRTEMFVDAEAQIHDNGTLQVSIVRGDDVVRRLTFAPGQWAVVDAWWEDA